MDALRILHCPQMVGGQAPQLARAERELGLQSWSVVFKKDYMNYPVDEVLLPEGARQWQWEVRRWRLLWRALRDFDIIHFNFGQTILPQWHCAGFRHRAFAWYARLLEMRDLPLLKAAGKGIVVTYQGDDARQGDFAQKHFPIHFAQEVEDSYYPPAMDARKRWRIAQVARYADRIYALNPDLLYVLPAQTQFLPYCHVDPRSWQVAAKPLANPPLIVHAPTHRQVKGTQYVLETIARLQAEGVACELALVEGMSNAEARKLYEKADLLIDQLLAGWYGGLAVELMALGKPVISYLREDDLHFVPAALRAELPIISAAPQTLYDVLKEWLTTRRHELPARGQQGRAFVERWHDPLKIAAQLKSEYENILARNRN